MRQRSSDAGSRALILTGSTARSRRTRISDIDYHVVGPRPETRDLRGEIDLYSDTPETFLGKLVDGDDFVQWSLRHGCVLFDDGVLLEAMNRMLGEDLWPDPSRKRNQAAGAIPVARSMVESGDGGAAHEQVRTVLSLTSRWWLLECRVFPLARDELAEQLHASGDHGLAIAMDGAIHGTPGLDKLASWLDLAENRLSDSSRC
ncbi:MAG: hypothetical protein U0R24_15080 [Solirubrobacterales bacterium]